jgi:hypothetical protein
VRQRNGQNLIVAIYVDDGLIAGSDESEIELFTDQLCRNFKITTGTLRNFLGMQVEQHQDGVRVPARLHGKGP